MFVYLWLALYPAPEVKENKLLLVQIPLALVMALKLALVSARHFLVYTISLELVMLVNQFFPNSQENFTGACLKAD